MVDHKLLKTAATGQAGLITFAVAVLVLLVVGGGSIAILKSFNATRTVVDQRSMQTYYVAMAGIQEALATRMYPASNFLNWRRPADLPGGFAIQPLYTNVNEGIVCNTATAPGMLCPNNAAAGTGMVGVYRYMILNGDQGVNGAASVGAAAPVYWDDNDYIAGGGTTPRKISPELFPTSAGDSAAEFIIVSKGTTCPQADAAGQPNGIVQPGTIIPNKQAVGAAMGFPPPACAPNSVRDELTLVARVMIDPDAPANAPDRVMSIQVFKDDTQLRVGLGRPVYIPGTGWTNAPFSFEPAFAYGGGVLNNPATPSHVVFYNFVTNQIICQKDIVGANTTIDFAADCVGGRVIGPKTVIQLYFQGPIDHRSIDPTNNFNFTECLDDGGGDLAPILNCNIQTFNGAVLASGYQMIFEPPKSNQLKLLPQLAALPGAGAAYRIQINTQNLRSWSGATGPPGPYNINFQVCPATGGVAPCPAVLDSTNN